jgi:hypothetical protein
VGYVGWWVDILCGCGCGDGKDSKRGVTDERVYSTVERKGKGEGLSGCGG